MPDTYLLTMYISINIGIFDILDAYICHLALKATFGSFNILVVTNQRTLHEFKKN